MSEWNVEQYYFHNVVALAADTARRRAVSTKEFRPPPIQQERTPFHLALEDLIPERTTAIQQAGKLVFHMVGDTGGVNGTGAQQNVADHMTRQITETAMPDQPSFFYHLGDVIYYHGEDVDYHDQFYFPYEDYPAPIFAIPGNHDGNTPDPADTLTPFYKHFCATRPVHAPEAGHSNRPTMTQPNCYWVLDAPLATVIGLYSNVSGALDDPAGGSTPQQDWLTAQLRSAAADKCLLLTVHHPLYSLGKHGGTELVRTAIEQAIVESGRVPDAIFTGHDHCYQRFTLRRDGRQIPVVVAGAGGFATYDDLARVDKDGELPHHVSLEASDDQRPGFLRLAITAKTLKGEYFKVPRAGREHKAAKLEDRFVLDLKAHRLR